MEHPTAIHSTLESIPEFKVLLETFTFGKNSCHSNSVILSFPTVELANLFHNKISEDYEVKTYYALVDGVGAVVKQATRLY